MSLSAVQGSVARRVRTAPYIDWTRELLGDRRRFMRQAKPDKQNRHVQYEPRTDFGRRMLELRRRVEASGERLLALDEIRKEVRLRRGGRD